MASFVSTATGRSAAIATLTVQHHAPWVSAAAGVSSAPSAKPFKLNVLGEITSIPYYVPNP